MRKMNDIEIVINNRKYTLSGYESESYLKSVAAYMNEKQGEFRAKDSFNRLDTEMKGVLVGLNIADDYFKAKAQVEELTEENQKKGEELFDIKHELISLQSRLEETQKELQALKEEQLESQKKIVRLETEIKERGLKAKSQDPEYKSEHKGEHKGRNAKGTKSNK